jgi:hypothetical protein
VITRVRLVSPIGGDTHTGGSGNPLPSLFKIKLNRGGSGKSVYNTNIVCPTLRGWSVDNPHVTRISNQQQRFLLNVWAGIFQNSLVGLLFIPNPLI